MDRIRPYLKRGENVRLSAKQSVNALLGMLGFDPQMFAAFEAWDRETKNLVRGCEAVAIQGSRLCVRVPSTVHRQELICSKERIIARVNQALGKNLITDVQFELAPKANENEGGRIRGKDFRQRAGLRKEHD